MIEIVLGVCMLQDPARCQDVYLNQTAANLTPVQCYQNSLPEVARWLDSNPNWVIKRWQCGPDRFSRAALRPEK